MEHVMKSDMMEPANFREQNDSLTEMQCDVSAETIARTCQQPCDKLKLTLQWIKNKLPIDAEYLNNVCITKDDINTSLKRVQPSSKREGFATVPDVTWNDVGSLKDVRESLQLAILVGILYTFSYPYEKFSN